jgi:hypothetical protein
VKKLILVRAKKPAIETFEFNPKVTLDTVPVDCAVFCFVIGKSDLSEELRGDLKALGEEYGKNLFVGFWDMADHQFQNVKSEYDIKKIPTILMTALQKYSAVQGDQRAFIKIPHRLLKSEHTTQTKELIRELYLSFTNGEIRRAASQAKSSGHKALLFDIVNKLGKFSEKFLKLLGEIGLEIEYAGAKMTLGKSS